MNNTKMKRIIAIVAGGDSSEHDVSLRSAEGIYSFMNKEIYDCFIIEINSFSWIANLPNGDKAVVDKNDFSFLTGEKRIHPDFAYITIHGTPGENGILQGYFDLIKLPYSTSNVLIESLTFNKYFLNQFLKPFNIKVADSILLRKGSEDKFSGEEIVNRLGLPCFVKPCADGSSFGVTKVKKQEELRSAIDASMKLGKETMIESFIDGTEITCGCYKTKKVSRVFPITEVVTNDEFFDYNAKYNGAVKEITPARISEETAKRVSELTSEIYDILGCEGIIRIDYILSGKKGTEDINLLEINTTPGMTATSFIPQQIKAAGLNISNVLSDIIENKI